MFRQWSSRRSGQPRTAAPSDDGLKLGQFAGIVQTCCDLVAREIGKFRDNVFSRFASCQVPEHKDYRNTCSFWAWFATQNLRVACNVVFPADWHGLILTRSYSKGKGGGNGDEEQRPKLQIVGSLRYMAGTTRLELATPARAVTISTYNNLQDYQ
jgi:hypothetical protein